MHPRKRVVINVATGGYINGQNRLRSTFEKYCDSDLMLFTREDEIGAPLHHDNPYAFKIYAWDKALQAGYKRILWFDASVFAIRNLKPIWDIIEMQGYIMQEAGQWLGWWINDRALEYFKLSRDDAMKMTCYGNAGFLGLDFDTIIASEFFEQWKNSMLAGCFKGAWTNKDKTESPDERCRGHRHDLACGSVIANRLGMKFQHAEHYMEYAPAETPPINDTIVLKACGMA